MGPNDSVFPMILGFGEGRETNGGSCQLPLASRETEVRRAGTLRLFRISGIIRYYFACKFILCATLYGLQTKKEK